MVNKKKTWKKIRSVALSLALCLAVGFTYINAVPQQACAENTTPDLIISNTNDFKAFRDDVNAGSSYQDKTVRLDADLDLGNEWVPVGTKSAPFSGNFDGNGHSITLNATFDNSSSRYFGVFGYLENAAVSGLATDGSLTVDLSSSRRTYIGAVAAYAKKSNFSECTNRADITISMNSSSVSTVQVYTGGVVGTFETVDSDSEEDISGYSVTGCVNYGNISGYSLVVGGISSKIAASVYNCVNYGDVSTNDVGMASAGGIAANIGGTRKNSVMIDGCCNYGTVGGKVMYASGISGLGYSDVANCYNMGAVTSSNDSSKGEWVQIGGITCSPGRTAANCYNTGLLTWTGDAPLQSGARTFIGEIGPEVEGGLQISMTNCYTSGDTFTAEQLGASFKEDINKVNGGYPLLKWQNGEADAIGYTVSFSVTPENADVAVYSDSDRTQLVEPKSDGTYSLVNGTYYYTVSKDGYVTEKDNFSVKYKAKTINVKLKEAAIVSFTLMPTGADFSLVDSFSKSISPDSSKDGVYTYTLHKGNTYAYTATAEGYNSTTHDYKVDGDENVAVSLTESTYGDEENGQYIYGSENDGKTSTISSGGTYYIGSGATGTMTISTSDPVTLMGTGIADSSAYKHLYIDCASQATDLTLQDVYISNMTTSDADSSVKNMFNFANGQSGNELTFVGTSVLDMDTNATGYAMVHVPQGTGITIGGATEDDTLYFYDREQGAGIGGNGVNTSTGLKAEYNGDITITKGNFFMKNSKQGALIGSGAAASGTSGKPGDIIIKGGVLNLLPISRGAALGGSAGKTGGATGADVYVYKDARINFNIDFSGSAIGGGGYDAGNDSDGGTLHYYGGSIRTFIDYNAVDPNGDGLEASSDTLWKGVTEYGVNDAAITADKVDADGNALILCKFNTDALKTKKTNATDFTVKCDGTEIYSGGLHQYHFINEDLHKDSQVKVDRTVSNWAPLDDSFLYFYMTQTSHELSVNGEKFTVTWDKDSGIFLIPDADLLDPVIKGIKDGGTYCEDVSFTASDEQKLASVTVDGKESEAADGKYTITAPDSESAEREIIATDAAGNKTKVKITQYKVHAAGDDATITKEATCQEEGKQTYTCTHCGETVTEAIPKAAHTWVEGKLTPATTAKDGSLVYTCTVCGETKSKTIKKISSVTLSASSYIYNGKARTPTVSVKDSEGKKLVKGADYTVKYASGRKNVGSYKVTVTFRGNYSGSVSKIFDINPKGTSISKLTKASKAFTVKWKKQSAKMVSSRITGYQVRYSLKSNMTSSKTVTFKGYAKISKKIKKLKAKKKYYVQVRTYMKVSGKNYYSAWSGKKSVTTKK